MNKKPRFFCDNCSTEVERHTKACPACGRFFASVRCPACAYAGDEKAFAAGCPSCGYSSAKNKDNQNRKEQRAESPPFKASGKKKFPLWAYILCLGASVVIFMLLLFNMMR